MRSERLTQKMQHDNDPQKWRDGHDRGRKNRHRGEQEDDLHRRAERATGYVEQTRGGWRGESGSAYEEKEYQPVHLGRFST